jgi:hypothetical protein
VAGKVVVVEEEEEDEEAEVVVKGESWDPPLLPLISPP